MGTKNNPAPYDCYANAEPDEPMFVLLARDPDAPRLVREWAIHREYVKPEDTNNARMIEEAFDCAAAMEDWHATNRPRS